MTPEQLRAARLQLGLTLEQMGIMLGYSGAHTMQQVRKMESGERTIRRAQSLLARAYLDGYRPDDWPERKNQG